MDHALPGAVIHQERWVRAQLFFVAPLEEHRTWVLGAAGWGIWGLRPVGRHIGLGRRKMAPPARAVAPSCSLEDITGRDWSVPRHVLPSANSWITPPWRNCCFSISCCTELDDSCLPALL